jgi:hypothetical protein
MAFEPDETSEHARLLLELKPQDWAMFCHHPIMKAFLAFQEDQIAYWRDICADLVEMGAFRLADAHEDRNPDVVRGKLIALKQLARISLADIQGFYGKSEPEESEQANA